MGAKQEARHHAEIAAATAKGPEQVRVIRFTGRYKAAVGEHDVGLDETVAGEAILPSEISMSAAERQAGDAGSGDDAERHGLAEQMSGVIDFARRAARTDPDCPAFRIDVDTFHCRQVNDQAVIHAAEARPVVAAAADGDAQALVAAKIHRRDDIGGIGAAHDEPRAFVDHGVIEFAG